MEDWLRLSHVRWECKYQVVFIPKYRRKVLYGKIRRQVGTILRDLCVQKGIVLLQCNSVLDHVHLVLSIPPKYGVAYVIGWLKGKGAIRIHREVLMERRVTGLHFWVRGYCVSTVGLDKQRVLEYVREQEKQDRVADGQLEIWDLK